MVFYLNEKSYRDVIHNAELLQTKIILIFKDDKYETIRIAFESKLAELFVSSILPKGQSEYFLGRFTESIGTYILGLNFLFANKKYVESNIDIIDTFLKNLINNYFITDKFIEIEKLKKNEVFKFFLDKIKDKKALSEISKIITIAQYFIKVSSYEKKQKNISVWIEQLMLQLNEQSSISGINKVRKKIILEYKSDFKTLRYEELKQQYFNKLEINENKLQNLKKYFSESVENNKKLLKTAKLHLKKQNGIFKTIQLQEVNLIQEINRFNKSQLSSTKSLLRSSKRDKRKVTRNLNKISKVSIILQLKWYFWKSILLFSEITIYVVLIGYFFKSIFGDYIEGAILSMSLGLIIFFTKRFLIAPKLEKLFFDKLHRNIIVTISDINLRYTLRYNQLFDLHKSIDDPIDFLKKA